MIEVGLTLTMAVGWSLPELGGRGCHWPFHSGVLTDLQPPLQGQVPGSPYFSHLRAGRVGPCAHVVLCVIL